MDNVAKDCPALSNFLAAHRGRGHFTSVSKMHFADGTTTPPRDFEFVVILPTLH